jgi:hypothetical protein
MMIKPRRASRRDESERELEIAACSESAGWATPEFQLAGPSHWHPQRLRVGYSRADRGTRVGFRGEFGGSRAATADGTRACARGRRSEHYQAVPGRPALRLASRWHRLFRVKKFTTRQPEAANSKAVSRADAATG